VRSIEINLARRPFRNDTPIIVALTLLVLVTVAFTAHNSYTYFTADTRLSNLEQELFDHRARMREFEEEASALRKKLSTVDLGTVAPQADFVSSVLQARNFSWTRLFNAFEEVQPWNVRLIAIRPQFSGGNVDIGVTAVAQDHEAYLGFQTALHDSPIFDKVVPGGYETEPGGSRRVFFDLTFRYRPDLVPDLEAEPETEADATVGAAGAETAASGTAQDEEGGVS
jgi:hypothetical protein